MDFDENMGQVLIRCARLWNEEGLARLKRVRGFEQISEAQLRVLAHISPAGVRLSGIARRMEVSKQAVQKLVAPMIERGVLKQIPDPRDGRAKLICLDLEHPQGVLRGLQVLSEVQADLEELVGAPLLDELHERLLILQAGLDELTGKG